MESREFDIWQHWQHYVCDRTLHLHYAIPKVYQDCFSTLYGLMQEEANRAIYEWNCLQFQKFSHDWLKQWSLPTHENHMFFLSHSY